MQWTGTKADYIQGTVNKNVLTLIFLLHILTLTCLCSVKLLRLSLLCRLKGAEQKRTNRGCCGSGLFSEKPFQLFNPEEASCRNSFNVRQHSRHFEKGIGASDISTRNVYWQPFWVVRKFTWKIKTFGVRSDSPQNLHLYWSLHRIYKLIEGIKLWYLMLRIISVLNIFQKFL